MTFVQVFYPELFKFLVITFIDHFVCPAQTVLTAIEFHVNNEKDASEQKSHT